MSTRATAQPAAEKAAPPLKPCPFDGGEAVTRRTSISSTLSPEFDAFWVECGVCEIGTKYHDSASRAAETWNRRAQSAAFDAAQKAVQEIASQKLSSEIEPADREDADFEYAYDMAITVARAALKAVEELRKGEADADD